MASVASVEAVSRAASLFFWQKKQKLAWGQSIKILGKGYCTFFSRHVLQAWILLDRPLAGSYDRGTATSFVSESYLHAVSMMSIAVRIFLGGLGFEQHDANIRIREWYSSVS